MMFNQSSRRFLSRAAQRANASRAAQAARFSPITATTITSSSSSVSINNITKLSSSPILLSTTATRSYAAIPEPTGESILKTQFVFNNEVVDTKSSGSKLALSHSDKKYSHLIILSDGIIEGTSSSSPCGKSPVEVAQELSKDSPETLVLVVQQSVVSASDNLVTLRSDLAQLVKSVLNDNSDSITMDEVRVSLIGLNDVGSKTIMSYCLAWLQAADFSYKQTYSPTNPLGENFLGYSLDEFIVIGCKDSGASPMEYLEQKEESVKGGANKGTTDGSLEWKDPSENFDVKRDLSDAGNVDKIGAHFVQIGGQNVNPFQRTTSGRLFGDDNVNVHSGVEAEDVVAKMKEILK